MERYDFVVVGAGSAGCVLAERLSADGGNRVLLLEAGPVDRKLEVRIPAAFAKLFKTAYDWDYSTAAQPQLAGRTLYWPRGRVLGGSSSINAQVYTRGHPADYDEWAREGNPGWSWEDVQPYFERAEDRCPAGPLATGLREPNPLTQVFLRAAAEAGLENARDLDGARPEGAAMTRVTQRRGRRWSAADAYLRPALRRGNLTVVTGALCTRVVTDCRRVRGVKYVRSGKPVQVRAEREVILCGGAVNSPQLLMLSGIGPAAELRAHGVQVVADLPGVGRNLQDHLAVMVSVSCTRPLTLVSAQSPANLLKYLLFRRGMLTSNVAEALAFVRSEPALVAPDVELIFAPVPFIDHGLVKPPGHGMTIAAVALQPRSRGAVSLASADPSAKPVIQPNYLEDPEGADLGTLVRGVALARRLFATRAFRGLVSGPIEPDGELAREDEVETFVRQQAETLYHPVGSCRMGTDHLAVVDAELRVRGLEGLRVVDASIMPVIPRGHTNAPTMMIAEKAADLILPAPFRARPAPVVEAAGGALGRSRQ